MLGEMAAGISHDVNNTLTTIVGTTEWLLRNAEIEDEAREDLTHIRMSATDAAVYIRRLQEAARQIPGYSSRLKLAAGDPPSGSCDMGLVDLAAIVAQVPQLSRPRWSELVDRGVPFEIVVDAEPVPPVRGSAPEIRELLVNLVFNAIDAMRECGGRLVLQVREVRGQVSVAVIDQGKGIPVSVRPHIFEPFYTTKGKHGTGLGLSMCWRIAQKHGGVLEIDSNVEQGTTVTLTVPVERDAPAAAQPVEHPRPPMLATQRVLLIDDQPDVRYSLTEMLRALAARG